MATSTGAPTKHALLLTGAPGAGKTTAIRRLAERLAGARLRGFTTKEIRVSGERVGFRLETFDGRSATLSHVDLCSADRIGKYGVDLQALDAIVDSALVPVPTADAIHLVDEIGRMECLSPRFVAAMTALLDSGSPLVATVAARGGGFIERVKRRRDVEVWPVTRATRDDLPERAHEWLRARRRS
jgi:nucleoside-triphosphatase